MTSILFGSPEFWSISGIFSKSPRTKLPEQLDADETQDATRNRRRFIDEMLTRSPDAFTSELDVQSMMHMYPGRF